MTMMAHHHHHRVSSLSSPSKSSFSAFLDLVRVAGSRHRARGTVVSPVNPTKGKNVNTLTLEDDGKKMWHRRASTMSATNAVRRMRFLLKHPRVKENLSAKESECFSKAIMPQSYAKSTISSKSRRFAMMKANFFESSETRRRGRRANAIMDDDTKKRKEDIRRLEMTLEQLKLTLERAERQAKEEMERIGPVDEEEAFEDDDDDDDDDGGDSSTSAFVTLTKEQKRFCDDDETKEHHPRVTQNNLEESSAIYKPPIRQT